MCTQVDNVYAILCNHLQALIGTVLTSIHSLDNAGAEWACGTTQEVLRVWQQCETPSVKAACCTALAEVGFTLESYQESIMTQLRHSLSDSRAAVREAAVAAVGRVQVCYIPTLFLGLGHN